MSALTDVKRLLHATLCGLVLAGCIHIVAVLLLPRFAQLDAFARLRDTANAGQAQLLSGTDQAWLTRADPAASLGACAYDLEDGPLQILARTGPLTQSVALHAKGGKSFYAVTDRAAVRNELNLLVMTSRQHDEALAHEDEDNPSREVKIVSPTTEGFAVIRVLAAFPSQRQQAQEAVQGVACTALEED